MSSASRPPLYLFWRGLFLLLLLAWLGVMFLWQQWQVNAVEGELRRELLGQATALAHTVPADTIPGGSAGQTAASRRLTAGLTAYRELLPYRGVSILGQRDGQIVWVAGAMAGREALAPGTVYAQPPEIVAAVFADGEAVVYGPYRRENASLISAFAPVLDPTTGVVRLVVGVDADANHWQVMWQRARADAWSRGIVLLALILLGFVFVWYRPVLRPVWRARLRYAEIYLVAAFGVSLTLILAQALQEVEVRSQRQTFYHVAVAEAELVRKALAEIENVASEATARFMTESPFVSRNEFRAFATPLLRHAHLAALGWVLPVPAERREAWERRARSEGVADFLIWEVGPDGQKAPATARPTHYPLWYVATAGEAVMAPGYDFASHPSARAALDKALVEGLSTATAPLLLPGQTQPTVLIFRPVVSGRLLRGLVVAFIPTASFLANVLSTDPMTEPAVTAVLYHLEAGQLPQPLAAVPASAADTPFTPTDTAAHLPDAVFPILAFDRAYALHISGQPRFLTAYPRRAGRAALLIGTLFTALVTGFTTVALRYRNELEAQVEARTTELRRREAYLATLLNTIGDVVFTVAWPERRITSVNRSITTVFGYGPDEVIGQSSRLFYLNEADYLAYGRALAAAQAQGQNHVQRELQLRHKDGHAFWAEAHTVFLTGGEWSGTLITLVRDISARKEAEARLRAGEERYRLLFDSMLNGVALYEVVYDEAGEPVDYRFLEVNPAFERLTGLRGAEIGGRTLREVLPDVETEWLERYAETVRSGQPVYFDHYSRPLKRHYEVSAYCPRPGELVSFFNDVTEREQAKERSDKQVQRLAALRAIDIATSSTFDLRTVLDVVIQHTTLLAPADAAAVWLVESGDYTLRGVVGRGFHQGIVEQSRVRFGQGLVGQAALERRMVHSAEPILLDETIAHVATDEGFVCAYAAPLIAKGELKGVLAVFCRHPHEPDADWLAFFEALAGQAAIAVDNAQLLERLQRAHMELAVAYEATIEGWARALDLRDRETEGHTRRVVELSERLARALGLSETEIVHIRRGALLHDIGKMAVPDHILLKPDKLTPEEETLMRRHPLFAYEMLAPIAYLRPALDIPHYHHERWDGSGYPYGLKGEQIPLAARLFAVVDVWDALRSDRPYRRAWSEKEAMAYLRVNRGVLFDPRVVDAFLRMLTEMDDRR